MSLILSCMAWLSGEWLWRSDTQSFVNGSGPGGRVSYASLPVSVRRWSPRTVRSQRPLCTGGKQVIGCLVDATSLRTTASWLAWSSASGWGSAMTRRQPKKRPTLAEIKAEWPPTVDVPTAGEAFGLSRSYSYELVARGEFPARVDRFGSRYVAYTESIIRKLSATD